MELGRFWMTRKTQIIAIAGAVGLAVLSAVCYFVILNSQPKQVTLTVDGVTKTYETHAATVQDFLAEQQISLADKDTLTPQITTPLTDNLTIQLDKSWAVPVVADGQTKVIHTLKRNVADVLQEAGIALREKDQVVPTLATVISKDTKIHVTRVDEDVVKVEERVPFQELRKNDANLLKGETRILQKGEEGKAIDHFKIVKKDGKEISREFVRREVITPKQDRIIAVGTMKKVTAKATPKSDAVVAASLLSRGGKDFRPHSVLKGVTLTAYSPEVGTRTASGRRAEAGRTIAVDPSVIPMGWWVYIEGVGYRRAEDTGGAVNGHKIDVFLGSESEARQFGRKKGKTVYIIGPKLP
ncbi:MAG: ubiquitin-like domain-containing protein [Clostridia bacterium]